MREARELQLILSVAEQLGEELGSTGRGDASADGPLGDREPAESWGPADARNARLVARFTQALTQIAAAGSEAGDEPDERVAAALARTELVIRGELMRGGEAALRQQLPGFVFLVVLPSAGMDRALELSNRARALLEEAAPD